MIGFSSLVDLLGRRADRDFGFTFLADASDSGTAEASRLSFRELDERARAIGADLIERGFTGERALLVYPPGLDYIAAFFGCLCAGVVAVPVFPPDMFRLSRTLPRLATVAMDSQAKVILTDSLILPLASTLSGQAGLEILAESHWIATDTIPAALAGEWRQPDIRPESTAFIQYTSGSVSTPKGVILSHENLLENSALIKETFGHTTESRGMSWLPIYHDMGLIGGVLQPLYSDFPITLMSPLSFLARPMSWLQAVARDGATTSGGPNFAYDLCVRKFDEQTADGLDLSAWRVAFNGAEPVRASTLDRFAKTFAPYGFRKSAFLPCYGLAEATLIVTGKKAGEAVREESFSAAGLGRGVAESSTSPGDTTLLVGSGTACTGVRVAVVDTATGHELPDRKVGEIRISGSSLGAGYWGQPDQSAETFVRSPRGGRWLRTGDLGFLDHGELFVTGREKDLIIVRGRNIYPHDVEQAAADAAGELRPGCVAAFGIQRADGEELVVVAEVRREADLSAANAITDRVRRAVTESQNVGVHEVVLVAPGTIPKTSSGKLQRSSCRQAYLDDTLEPLGRSRPEHVPAARPDVDPVALRELSQEARHPLVTDYVIGLLVSAGGSAHAESGSTRAEISTAEPITSLGLDSLASVLVLHRIELQLDIELPVSTLLNGRSISELVDLICAQLDESPRALTPASQETQVPLLSEGQRSLWFMQQLEPDSSAYNLARAFAIGSADRPDDLDRDALDASLCLLLERHTCLRTTFHSDLGVPFSRVAPPARTLLRTVMIAPDALDDAMAEEAERPFDLERDPLLRAVLFVTPAAAPVLLITVHHIAVDLWSFSILLHELSAMYPALAEGRQPALPAPSSYQAYVRHQEETLRARGESLADYWHGKLAGELPVIELPDPRTRPEVQTHAGATWRRELSTQQTAQIRALATAARSTPFLVLLSGLQAVLHRYTGVDDILIGTVVAGRRHAAFASIVGYLVNTVVLRADLSGDPSFAELLGRNGITFEEAITHQDYPFPRVVADLSNGSDPSRSPVFQVMIAFEQSPGEPALAGLAIDEPGCTLKVGGTAWVSRPLPSRGAAFDLTLRVVETCGRLITSWEYNTDVLEEGLVAQLSLDLAALLGAAADTPGHRIGELPVPGETGAAGRDLSDKTRKPGPRTSGDPVAARAKTGPMPVEPDYRVSGVIRQIYADLLAIPDIGPDDDFFEEGGHSLLATQLAARVRAALGVELSTRTVFTASTIRQLAAHVTREQQASGSLSAPGPRPTPASGPAPLSYPQRRLWFVDQLSPDTAAYNIPIALRLQGPLDVAALAGSFDGVLRRHQALRTYFPMTETGPVQSVSDADPPRLSVIDATQTPEDEFGQEVAQAARRPFDLGKGPLVRLALYRRAAEDHVLLLVMHHIIADGWSLGVMTEEVIAGYEALTRGRPDPGVPPQIQYPDYTRWLSEHGDDAQGEHLAYWTQHLDGSVPLNLPTRQPRPALQSFAGAHHHWQLDAPTTQALRQVCRSTDGTLFMVLLAAYGLLLGRHSYATDVVIGTPISGRTHLETERVIGFFANTLALRLDLSGDPAFTDLVLRVREVCLDGYAHQAVPFERLIEALQPARDLGRNPLFQSAFVLQNTPRPTPQLTGLAVERIELDTATSKFDISLELEESNGGLAGAFEYCTDLFDQDTICRLASDFTKLLHAIAAGPHQPISALTAATITPTAITPQPAPTTELRELISLQSRSTPKALAVSHGPQSLTYEQLVARAETLAGELRARGLGRGSRIGLYQGRGADWVVGLLAVLVSGAACVLMDPRRPEEWNERVLREGRPHLVLHGENEPAAGPAAIAAEGRWPGQETGCVCFGDDALAGADIDIADLTAHVMAIRQEMAITAGDRVIANSPQWQAAALWECLAALTCGATFVVAAAGEESSAMPVGDARAVVLATPEQADALGQAGDGPRVVRIGESLPAHPAHALRVLLTSLTAPTLSWEFDAADGRWYGRPLGAAQTEIRDRFGQPVEPGVCGQLHATGTARTIQLTAEPAGTPAVLAADAGPGRQPVWHPTDVLARYGPDGRVEWLGSVQGAGRKEKIGVPAVAPRTPAEEVVEAVWREVLGGGPFSVHDDFFDLGGHSLAAVQIIDRIHSIFQVKVPIQSVFQDPNIAGFASVLTSLERTPGQTEKIAMIWTEVTGAASGENAPATSAADL